MSEPILVSSAEMKQRVLSIPRNDGCIFSVVFIKRSTGRLRKMLCRVGVTRHLAGGVLPYNAKEHELLNVFDVEKKDYRSIATESVQELHIHGEVYKLRV